MELRDYIEEGAKKAGSLTELGKLLDMSQPNMSHVKGMRKPLPLDAAVRLADYIGADLRKVLAANELVTEKKEEKRAFWSHLAKAASFALAIGLVTNFVTPSPAEASYSLKASGDTLYYVKSRRTASWKKSKLFRTILEFFKGFRKTPVTTF